jgi:hypothetical protein
MANSWLTVEELRDRWPDAPIDDAEAEDFMDAAFEQCVTFLNDPEAEGTPSRRLALVMQTRSVWRATEADSNEIGPEGFAITAFPMDWQVKNLLRPKSGMPRML